MNISIIPIVLALIIVSALTYLACHIAQGDENVVLLGIGTALTYLSTLGVSMATSHKEVRTNVNLKVWCSTMFIIMLIANMLFAWLGVNEHIYIITIATLLVLHIFIAWKISNVKILKSGKSKTQ